MSERRLSPFSEVRAAPLPPGRAQVRALRAGNRRLKAEASTLTLLRRPRHDLLLARLAELHEAYT